MYLINIIDTTGEPDIITQIIDNQLNHNKFKTMENQNITPELVQEMYRQYPNQQHFINVFGTKKFKIQKQDELVRMFNFLAKKVKINVPN